MVGALLYIHYSIFFPYRKEFLKLGYSLDMLHTLKIGRDSVVTVHIQGVLVKTHCDHWHSRRYDDIRYRVIPCDYQPS